MQLLINGLLNAAVYALVAFSFGLVYRVAGFLYFAHAAVLALGPYSVYALHSLLGVPFFVSVTAAIAICAAVGSLMDIAVHSPLRLQGSTSMVHFLASLGLYVVLQNLLSLVLGDDSKTIRYWSVHEGINVAGARITVVQVLILCVSASLLIASGLLLKKTRLGMLMRAVGTDPYLAESSGVHGNKVILLAFAIGSGLAGATGILSALDANITPTFGINAMMMGIVVLVIGGAENPIGISVGAFVLAMSQQVAAWFLGAQWQIPAALLILFVLLIIRPAGFATHCDSLFPRRCEGEQ